MDPSSEIQEVLTTKTKKKMSATENKKATAATSETIADPFHEAIHDYEQALKSGIQLQEESVKLWKDLLTKLGSPEELQAKLESMRADVFPKARERVEEFAETFDRMSKQTIDLFEKTLRVYQAASVTDAQRRVQDLIESWLAALQVNNQYLVPRAPNPLEIWNFDRQLQAMQAGKRLRIPLKVAFRLRWSVDNWITFTDTSSTPTAEGIHYVDVPTNQNEAGSLVEFTFYWTEPQRWEGVNYNVRLTA
jgi:hypothetical protein